VPYNPIFRASNISFIIVKKQFSWKGGVQVNKNDLVTAVAEDSGLSKKDAKVAVESVINNISSSLTNGSTVQLIGFGTFSVVERAAKKGVNPATGAPIHIPACKTVKFKCGSSLKEAVN